MQFFVFVKKIGRHGSCDAGSRRQEAVKFKVPHKTLEDRVKGRVKHGTLPGPKTVLTGDEESRTASSNGTLLCNDSSALQFDDDGDAASPLAIISPLRSQNTNSGACTNTS